MITDKKGKLRPVVDGLATEATQQSVLNAINGISGAGVYDKLFDEGATYTYIGQAAPGTATSADSWQIKRITEATGDTVYAGTGAFDQIWDNRASLF